MNTIFTKEIDGVTVVLGFDKEKIDSIATAKKIKPLIQDTKEFKAQAGRLKKIKDLNIENSKYDQQVKNIANRASQRTGKLPNEITGKDLTASEVSQVNKFTSRRKDNITEIEKIQEDLPEVEKKLKKRTAGIIKKNASYFPLNKDGEERIDEGVYSDLKEKHVNLKKGQFLNSDGKVITDYRNKTFYGLINEKWDIIKVDSLAEEIDTVLYCLFEDLTDEQRKEITVQVETDRIDGMTDDEKQAEKTAVLDSLATQAGNMKVKLDIQGVSDSLKQAKDWYAVETAVVDSKYL